jgi:hypothetical protein
VEIDNWELEIKNRSCKPKASKLKNQNYAKVDFEQKLLRSSLIQFGVLAILVQMPM